MFRLHIEHLLRFTQHEIKSISSDSTTFWIALRQANQIIAQRQVKADITRAHPRSFTLARPASFDQPKPLMRLQRWLIG